MRSITTARPTPAFVLALVALLFSMAGTGYAAAQLSGKQLKKRSVPADRVMNNTLTGTQIKESKLGIVPLSSRALLADTARSADTAKTALAAETARAAETAKTATTAETAKTADKALDADRLGGREPGEYLRSVRVVRSVVSTNIAAGNGAELTASCAAGEHPISGGGAWYITGTTTTIGSGTLSTDIPVTTAQGVMTGWRAEGKNTSPVARDFRAFVVCAAPAA